MDPSRPSRRYHPADAPPPPPSTANAAAAAQTPETPSRTVSMSFAAFSLSTGAGGMGPRSPPAARYPAHGFLHHHQTATPLPPPPPPSSRGRLNHPLRPANLARLRSASETRVPRTFHDRERDRDREDEVDDVGSQGSGSAMSLASSSGGEIAGPVPPSLVRQRRGSDPLSAASSSMSLAMDEEDPLARVAGKSATKNPLKRLSRLLLEESKIAERERVGEAVVQEDITVALEATVEDDEGDTVMKDPDQVVIFHRRGPRSGSHLNPSNQAVYTPSPASSATPSPTVLSFPSPLPFGSAAAAANSARSPRTLVPLARATSPPPVVLGKRTRTSSLSDQGSQGSRPGSSTGSSGGGAGGPHKRARTTAYSHDPSPPPSQPASLRSTPVRTNAAWQIPGNAGRQVPLPINIQGASLAFSRMDLDEEPVVSTASSSGASGMMAAFASPSSVLAAAAARAVAAGGGDTVGGVAQPRFGYTSIAGTLTPTPIARGVAAAAPPPPPTAASAAGEEPERRRGRTLHRSPHAS
ncbi:hypothetical protein H9P43_004855 [Blastocladiella emersonii ATCC 22665]|nr:hypothetical protein H9P43_004855 [Blastocladiella emersonii ATCC 22665]